MITGAQIRAARGLTRWSAERLAEESGLGVATIRRGEAVDWFPGITRVNGEAVERAFKRGGVVFTPEGGVRWRDLQFGDPVVCVPGALTDWPHEIWPEGLPVRVLAVEPNPVNGARPKVRVHGHQSSSQPDYKSPWWPQNAFRLLGPKLYEEFPDT